MKLWTGYLTIAKTDAEQRLVSGVASTEAPDSQGDVVTSEAIAAALPDYMKWANIREMHDSRAAGVAMRAEVVEKCLEVDARIVDDEAWRKVTEGVYKGFSIGGRVKSSKLEKRDDGTSFRRITGLELFEISLVDRPANPEARISLWKAEGEETSEIGVMSIADCVNCLQHYRNACEVAGDLGGASLYTAAIANIMRASDLDIRQKRDFYYGDGVDGHEAALKVDGPPELTPAIEQAPATLVPFDVEAPVVKALTPIQTALADLAKAVAPTSQAVETLTQTVTEIGQRLDHLERQPTNGGPILRVAEKVLAGQREQFPAETSNAQPSVDLSELRRLAMTEPNPALRRQYQDQLNVALAR